MAARADWMIALISPVTPLADAALCTAAPSGIPTLGGI